MTTSTAKTTARRLSEGQQDTGIAPRVWRRKIAGLLGGILLAAVIFVITPESELSDAARITAALGVLMGVWWVTEAAPIPVTALLPLLVFPLTGVTDLSGLSGSYANSIIFLFLGGFLLALALERWNLHRRIALRIVLFIGTRPTRLIAGFMIATAFLSMWVSNTATAMMMIPMGMSLMSLVNERRAGMQKQSNFSVALMLGIAYAATCGGFGTMIGSPVNVIIVGYIRESLGVDVTFLQWMGVGVPLMVVMIAVGWVVLTQLVWRPEVDELPGGHELFQDQLAQMGPMARGERLTLMVFGLTAAAWVLVPLVFPESPADDSVIAMCAGIALFLIPADPGKGVMVMDWATAKRMPWDVLILFGGGLALSSQILDSGLSQWIGTKVAGLSFLPFWLIVIVIVVLLLFLTEFTSSTATAAAFVPVVGGIAGGLGADPVVLAVAAGLACMCAFMLPVGTPPNAVAFGSGAVTLPQMVRSGVWMNLFGLVAVVAVVLTLVPLVFG